MYKFIPNGSLTKIILPYTKEYKNVSFNNFLEPLTLNFSENEKIGFFVYQKNFQNKKIYTILEIQENISYNRYEPYDDYISTSLILNYENKKNFIEEKVILLNDFPKSTKSRLIYNLKIDSKVESRFHYNNIDNIHNNIDNNIININDRLSLHTINLLKKIENELKKSYYE